ncbi:MAG TPA: T9SS type A sorting domain-containing protein [Bacteroidia bacterium]|jgi:hypothetical protein
MKKSIFFLGLFGATALSAQITITSADMPNAGDSVLLSVSNSIGSIDPMLTDSAYTWDYSTLVPTLQRYEKFDSPLTFTVPFNIIFNPVNTSYGNVNNLLTSLPIPGITLDEAYDFMKESSSSFKQVGAGYTINGTPLPFMYSASDVLYKFPMNYLDTDSCDYKFGLPIPTLGYYGQSGHRVNVVDGWGTLITPFGTFNTLRVKSTVAAVDTINAFGFGTNISRPLRYEYKWLANGKQIPVLQIDASDVGGVVTVTNVQYIDSVISGVPQLGLADNEGNNLNVIVYPNPVIDNTTLHYSLPSKMQVKISIADVVGRRMAIVADEMQNSGTYQKQIAVSELGLTQGIYFLILETDTGTAVQQIVITK